MLNTFHKDFVKPQQTTPVQVEEKIPFNQTTSETFLFHENTFYIIAFLESERTIKKSLTNHSKKILCDIHFNLALIHDIQDQKVQAIQHIHHSLAVAEELFEPSHKIIAFRYLTLGNAYYNAGKYKKALQAHTKSLDLFDQMQQKDNGLKMMNLRIYKLLIFDYLWLGQWFQIMQTLERSAKAHIKLLSRKHPKAKRYYMFYCMFLILHKTASASLFIFCCILTGQLVGVTLRKGYETTQQCCNRQDD